MDSNAMKTGYVYDSSVKEEIKKMSAAKIMETFCPAGNALPGITIEHDYNREITKLLFTDSGFMVEIHNKTVIVK